jgi:AraC-like DNA-binding protein
LRSSAALRFAPHGAAVFARRSHGAYGGLRARVMRAACCTLCAPADRWNSWGVADDTPRKPRYQRHPHLGIETVAYRGPLERMPTHAHAQFQLTLYDGGARRFRVARQDFAGAPRASIIIQAGEPHASVPIDDPVLTLRTLYIEESLMAEVAASLWGGHGHDTVAFRAPLLDDAVTVARLHAAHRALDRHDLESEEQAYLALERLVLRHAQPTGTARPITTTDACVATVREILHDRAAENVRLDELAAAAGLSRFHLIRAFQRRYGVTPFAYQRNQRIEKARAVLRTGRPIADVAVAAGFADQSHLGRTFRAVMGATPGEYRASYLRALR